MTEDRWTCDIYVRGGGGSGYPAGTVQKRERLAAQLFDDALVKALSLRGVR